MNVFCVCFCATYFTVKSSDFSWCAAKIIAALLKLQKEKKIFKQVCFMLSTLILLRIKEACDSVSVWLKRWLSDQFDSLSRRNVCSFSLSSHPNTVALKRS